MSCPHVWTTYHLDHWGLRRVGLAGDAMTRHMDHGHWQVAQSIFLALTGVVYFQLFSPLIFYVQLPQGFDVLTFQAITEFSSHVQIQSTFCLLEMLCLEVLADLTLVFSEGWSLPAVSHNNGQKQSSILFYYFILLCIMVLVIQDLSQRGAQSFLDTSYFKQMNYFPAWRAAKSQN